MQFEPVAQRIYAFDEREFGQGASYEEIQQAQQQLGVRFPLSYVSFLKEFGWGGIGYWELFGLGSDVPIHLNLIIQTRSEREEMQPKLAAHLIPIMNNGAGDLYCLNSKKMREGECPVVFWDHEAGSDQEPDEDAENFLFWLSERLDESY